MPQSLVLTSVASPAFYGVNTQRKSDILPFQWATKADNCIIDDSGRIAVRKGHQRAHATAISGSPAVRSIFEYIDAASNTVEIFASGNAIYKIIGSTTTDISGSITTPSGDNWQFQNFNGKCIAYQTGHSPIVMSTVGGSFADITLAGTQQPTTNVDACLASFGRIWTLDGADLKYSDSLIETDFNGVFDLSTVWLSGMDIPVALAEFNGHLVIFGRHSIVVYSHPWSPTSDMQVVENIGGMGCIARDSIQHVGDDIIFLSSQGIRSLGRTIQEKSMPIRVISGNVNDELNFLVQSETLANIKSAYSKVEGFYVLTLPTSDKTYYFDLRQALPDGSFKTTIWNTSYTGMYVNNNDKLRLGTTGYINTYQGYLDGVLSDGTGGAMYNMVYESGWNDLESSAQGIGSLTKVPKRIAVLVLGGTGQTLVIKWAFDFVDKFYSFSKTLDTTTLAEYNVSEYNVAEYGGGSVYNRVKAPMSKSGQLIKFGINIMINGAAVALQQIDMYTKVGRIGV